MVFENKYSNIHGTHFLFRLTNMLTFVTALDNDTPNNWFQWAKKHISVQKESEFAENHWTIKPLFKQVAKPC